jgi:hypothetical protein
VPGVLIFGLGLYRAAYQKFLLVTAAPLSLLLARGMVVGWRIAGRQDLGSKRHVRYGLRAVAFFLVVLFLMDTGSSLNNLYFNEAYARADYRAIARTIKENARQGDGVILNAPNQWEVFTYYHPEDEHVFPLARQRPFDVVANRAELERIVIDHRRLFAVFWGDTESDPERFIESWLEAHTYKASEEWYGDVRLAVYAVPAEVTETPAVPTEAWFGLNESSSGPMIYLDGYTLLNERLTSGDILQLALFWHVEEPMSERFKVFVHLYDGEGQLVAQTDSEPGAALRPTNRWTPGEQIIDRYGVLMPADLTGGTYTLAVGLYELAKPDSRLAVSQNGVSSGDRLDLAQIQVKAGAKE